MLFTNKIKATAEGRQRTCIKLECIANNATFTAGGQCDLCGGHTFNTSDHMSRKTGYTRRIPYKTGIGIATPLKQKATHDAPASFLLSVHTHTLSMVGCMGLTSVRLVSFAPVVATPYSPPPASLLPPAVVIFQRKRRLPNGYYPCPRTYSERLYLALYHR